MPFISNANQTACVFFVLCLAAVRARYEAHAKLFKGAKADKTRLQSHVVHSGRAPGSHCQCVQGQLSRFTANA